MKLITVYSIVDRLKINGSCARAGIRELVKQGKIVEVSKRGHFILTRLCLWYKVIYRCPIRNITSEWMKEVRLVWH